MTFVSLKAMRKALPQLRRITGDPEANAIFLELLTESEDPETLLRMMNEAGVLGRFIPDFGRIVEIRE